MGCFGRVVKAEAVGLKDCEQTVKTVAVKMVRSQTNVAALEDLIAELKIMIYLGAHLNVVNLLGACTKNIAKGANILVHLFIIAHIIVFRRDFSDRRLLQIRQFANVFNKTPEGFLQSSRRIWSFIDGCGDGRKKYWPRFKVKIKLSSPFNSCLNLLTVTGKSLQMETKW